MIWQNFIKELLFNKGVCFAKKVVQKQNWYEGSNSNQIPDEYVKFAFKQRTFISLLKAA